MAIDMATIQNLRSQTGAGVLDCKNALEETGGDIDAALDLLRKKGIAKAGKKAARSTKEGLIHSYIHGAGKVGVMVEVLCETDFVARNESFQEFVHDLALHIAAAAPLYVSQEEVPGEVIAKEKDMAGEEFAGSGKPQDVIDKILEGKLGKYYEDVCLLDQRFVKDEDKTIKDLLTETIAKTGENVQITRFTRYTLGEQS